MLNVQYVIGRVLKQNTVFLKAVQRLELMLSEHSSSQLENMVKHKNSKAAHVFGHAHSMTALALAIMAATDA